MEQTYILVVNGKPEGPFSVEELKARNLQPGDFVKTAAMNDYKEAHEVAELRQLFGFEKQVLLQYFGSFDQRATAAALDWFFVAAACVIPTFLVSLLVTNQLIGLGMAFSLLVTIPIVNLIYHITMESSAKQATYGKQLLKIRVCDLKGNRLSPSQAAGRNLTKILSVFTLFVGYLMAFFNKHQQCLHDKIAGTLVVKDRL